MFHQFIEIPCILELLLLLLILLHLYRFRRIMVHFDGHEVAVLGTMSGLLQICQTHLGKGWFKMFVHTQPIAAASCILFGIGIGYPLVAVPIRRALKLPTNQYDADHPNVTFPKYDI